MAYIPFTKALNALRAVAPGVDAMAVVQVAIPIASELGLDPSDVFSMCYLLVCGGVPLDQLDGTLRNALVNALNS